jgi:hypothetical protein
MNKDEFKKNLHKRVRLVPIARRVDAIGRPIEQFDDEWIVDSINEIGAVLRNTRNPYIPTLSYDQIHSYMADPLRSSSSTECGFLVLKVQIYMGPDKIWVVPNLRPGEPA